MTCNLFDMPAFAPEHRGGPRECADKLLSESAEVFGEVRHYDEVRTNDAYGREQEHVAGYWRDCVALELADVLQVCRNICAVCHITPRMMADAMQACYEKNCEKDGGRY